jgi:ankyrin repeat protein
MRLRLRYIELLFVGSACLASGPANDLRVLRAAKDRDTAALPALLRQHAAVNSRSPDGSTALHWAAHWNDLGTADLLIRAGADVNAANDYGITPLWESCENGSSAMTAKLLAAGAKTSVARPSGETPLMEAARSGNAETAELLLNHGADPNLRESRRGQSALMWAVAENHTDLEKALIAHGADVQAKSKGGFSAILFAAQQGNLDSVKLLLAAGANVNDATPLDGNTLVVAAASNHETLALYLLDRGADVKSADSFGVTALHFAIAKGLARICGVGDQPMMSYLYRPDMLRLVAALLQHGADPNGRIAKFPAFPSTRHIMALSPVGATPYLLAAGSYDVALMRMLVKAGAKPSIASKDNTTALIIAAGLPEGLTYSQERKPDDKVALEAVRLAVELGADVNAANEIGDTALHGAAYMGANDIIQFLVEKGAKVNVANKYGQTPLNIAEYVIPPQLTDRFLRPYSVHPSTVELLLKLGAAPTPANGAQQ